MTREVDPQEDVLTHASPSNPTYWSRRTDAMAASYVECQVGKADDAQIVWGVGIDSSITTSALKSIISAINRSQRQR